MVLADSHRISHVPRYSGYSYVLTCSNIVYGTITPYGATFQMLLLDLSQSTYICPTTPAIAETLHWFGLSPSSLAATYGNHYCFLFLRVLRCFSSPGYRFLSDDIASQYRVTPFGNLRTSTSMCALSV